MRTGGQSLRQAFRVGVIWSVLQKWGHSVLAFVVFLVLVRLLEPEDFGLVAMAGVLLAFLQVFVDQGLGSAIVQRHADLEPRYLNTAFWFTMGAGLLLTGAAILGSGLVAAFFGEPQLEQIVNWLSLTFVFAGLMVVQEAVLRRKFAFKTLAGVSLLGAGVGSAVGVALALAGFGVWSLVWRHLVTNLTTVVALWSVSGWRPGLGFSVRHLKELVGFGVPVLATNLLFALNKQVDQLLIGYFLHAQVLGVYAVARTLISNVSNLVNGVALQVGLPTFSRMQKEPARAREALYKITYVSGLIVLPVFFGLAMLAPELVVVLFGSDWAPAIPVMQILCFLGVLQCLTSWSGVIMTAFGRPMWRLAVAALNASTNAVVVILAAPWGIVTVAAAIVIRGYLIMPPVHAIMMRKLIGFEPAKYLRRLAVPLGASVLMLLAVGAAKHLLPAASLGPILMLLIGASLGTVVYALALAALDPPLVRELWRAGTPILLRPFARSRRAT